MDDATRADKLKGRWLQARGVLRETWSRVVGDEHGRIRGQREQLEGYLQAHAAADRDGHGAPRRFARSAASRAGRAGYRSER